jgi:ubiquinone/menaquinone biosynthesis C-methylase UbiE
MDGLKIHCGSGCIYLTDGWVNVDLWRSGAALAKDCSAGVAKWGTTSDKYYERVKHIDELYLAKGTPDHQAIVCDAYGSWTNLPFDDESVSEIWSVQCFEHLSRQDAERALMEAWRVMKVGANLRLGVPDHTATLNEWHRLMSDAERLAAEDPFSSTAAEMAKKTYARAAFMLRHLLGSQKNDFAYHMGSWTRQKLIDFCKRFGFRYVCDEPNINFYPSIHLKFEKLRWSGIPELDDPIHPWMAAHQYCLNGGPLTVPDGYRVLEVGPGTAPWPRANAYYDIVPRELPNFTLGDVQKLPYQDDEFDFILISHVLEHVPEPWLATAELSRVAKSGCVICPTMIKEGMFLAHEHDHKWWVIGGNDCLYIKRIPERCYESLFDIQISGEMHRIWRYGERRLEGLANRCKRHFHTIEPMLDVIHFWSPEKPLKIQVLE